MPTTRHDHGRDPISAVSIRVASPFVKAWGQSFMARNWATYIEWSACRSFMSSWTLYISFSIVKFAHGGLTVVDAMTLLHAPRGADDWKIVQVAAGCFSQRFERAVTSSTDILPVSVIPYSLTFNVCMQPRDGAFTEA
jgi:hypothetical protein